MYTRIGFVASDEDRIKNFEQILKYSLKWSSCLFWNSDNIFANSYLSEMSDIDLSSLLTWLQSNLLRNLNLLYEHT